MLARLWHSLRVEDAVLFGWLVLVQPLISELGSGDRFVDLSREDDPLVGLVYLVAAGGALVCLATRSPGETAFEFESARSLRSYAIMPFMVALCLVASVGAENAGIASAEGAFVPVAALAVACYVLYDKLPTLAPAKRRALMTPCVLLCAGIFNGTMVDVFDAVDVKDIFDALGGDPRAVLAVLALLVLFSAPFYAMFVFAPRQVTESEGTWPAWAARYGLFLVGAIAGVGWLAAIGS
jgi:hypothetical protein